MSGSGRETLPKVSEWWEALLDVRQLLGRSRMSRRPSRLSGIQYRMFGSGRLALPDVQEW